MENTSQGTTSEFEVLTQGFVKYLLSLGRSPRTAFEYGENVKRWMDWWQRPLEAFKETQWDDWVIYLAKSGKKNTTIKLYRIALRRFFKYLRRREVVTHDPSRDSEPIKLKKYLPTWLTEEEIDRMISKARKLKFRAVLEVLYSCGLRNEECRTLTLNQIHDDTLQVIGKGQKERIVPVPPRAKMALDAWLKVRPTETALVFPSLHQKLLTAKNLRLWVQRHVRAAGITKRVTAHTLRHSIATHLAERGVPIERIQLFLGHESPETTMIYIHLSQQLVHQSIRDAHPHKDPRGFVQVPGDGPSKREPSTAAGL